MQPTPTGSLGIHRFRAPWRRTHVSFRLDELHGFRGRNIYR